MDRTEVQQKMIDAEDARADNSRLAAALRTAEVTIMQLQNKLQLLTGQLDDETDAVEAIHKRYTQQVEELKASYEERMIEMREVFEKKIQSTEERAIEAEGERRRSERSKHEISRELSKLQLEVRPPLAAFCR